VSGLVCSPVRPSGRDAMPIAHLHLRSARRKFNTSRLSRRCVMAPAANE
jgi:hypothetical protein